MDAARRDTGGAARQASLTRALGALMFLMGAALLMGAAPFARGEMQARMDRGLGVLLVLASGSLLLGSGRRPATLLSGIVIAVEHDSGTLSLQHADATVSRLKVDPELLQGIRCGDPVRVVVEDMRVRGLGTPSRGWRWDRAREGPALRRRTGIGGASRALKRGSAWASRGRGRKFP